MKAEVGMKFFDAYSGTHEVTRIDERHYGFFHVYNDGEKQVEGFMLDVAFERLAKIGTIWVL